MTLASQCFSNQVSRTTDAPSPARSNTKSSCHRKDRNLGNRVDNRLHTILETWQHPRLLFQAAFCVLQSLSFHLPATGQCKIYEALWTLRSYHGNSSWTSYYRPTATTAVLTSLLNENVLLLSQGKILWKHWWLNTDVTRHKNPVPESDFAKPLCHVSFYLTLP